MKQEAETAASGYTLSPLVVVARNTASEEQGSIHDDEQARRAGYRGGLVPGATSLAYVTHRLTDFFGPAWVERGHIALRMTRPVYEGERVTVHATVRERQEREGGADLTLDCWLVNPDGNRCVEGTARCPVGQVPTPEPEPWPLPTSPRPAAETPESSLPPLQYEDIRVGDVLRPLIFRVSAEEASAWAAGVDDHTPWYREAFPFGGAIVHPARFSVDPIYLIQHNGLRRGRPGIFVACDMAYHAPGFADRDYTVYGYVADKYERKGHRYLVVDSRTVDESGREIVRNRYTAIVQLRGQE